MIIDFHTHIFPDALAPRVIPNLTHIISENPSMNGTINGLVESMRTSHIDLSIVLPVVTKPKQFRSITQFALEVNERFEHTKGPRLLSFAGIHPDTSDYMLSLIHICRLLYSVDDENSVEGCECVFCGSVARDGGHLSLSLIHI